MKKIEEFEPYDEQVTNIHIKKGTRDQLLRFGPFDSTYDRSLRRILNHIKHCDRYRRDKK